MFDIYQEIKELIPITKYLKKRINDEFLIIATNSGEIRYLNEVAKDFYLAVDGQKTLEELLNILLSIYNVDRIVLEKDIVDLVRDLQWQDLLELKELKEG